MSIQQAAVQQTVDIGGVRHIATNDNGEAVISRKDLGLQGKGNIIIKVDHPEVKLIDGEPFLVSAGGEKQPIADPKQRAAVIKALQGE